MKWEIEIRGKERNSHLNLIHETPKAFLVENKKTGTQHWVPKSLVWVQKFHAGDFVVQTSFKNKWAYEKFAHLLSL